MVSEVSDPASTPNSYKNTHMTANISQNPFEIELKIAKDKRRKLEQRRAERSHQNLEDYIRSKTKTRNLEKKLLRAIKEGKTETKLFNLPKKCWFSFHGWDSLDGLDYILNNINDGFGTKAMCM